MEGWIWLEGMIPALECGGTGGSEHLVQHDLKEGVATFTKDALGETDFVKKALLC